jgi:hypothetical protein
MTTLVDVIKAKVLLGFHASKSFESRKQPKGDHLYPRDPHWLHFYIHDERKAYLQRKITQYKQNKGKVVPVCN